MDSAPAETPPDQEERGPVVGVGGVAVSEGSILLIRRARAPSRGLWAIPGGRVQWGESMEEALRREIIEETGLDVEVGEIAGVAEALYPDEGFHYVIVDYFVNVLGGELKANGDAEAARWVPLADIDDLPLVPKLLEALRDFGVV